MAFASPGVSIKEIDLTATLSVADQNIGCVVIAAEAGPVDTITYVTSEKELVDTFGYPNSNNYESWFAAQTIIQYGGIAAVIRPSGENVTLRSAYKAPSTITNFILKNSFEFENWEGSAFYFSGRTPGKLFNSIKVLAVDHGVDQILTYDGAVPGTGAISATSSVTGTAKSVYSGVASSTGTGTFNVTKNSGGTYSVAIASGGSGYTAGATITILGTLLGGASPANDVTLTNIGVTGGAITGTGTVTGTAKVSYTATAQSSTTGIGTGAQFTVTVNGTSYSVTTTTAGTGYVTGDTVTILGTSLGGATTANDLTFTVTGAAQADPVITDGTEIAIKNGATQIGTGWVYRVDSTNNKLYIVLNDSTKKIPTTGFETYSVTTTATTPVTILSAGDITNVDNGYYSSLTYGNDANGNPLYWNSIAPQPGTSATVAAKGGKFDEMHIIVIDEDGGITGTPNALLEKYTYVSKAKDASNLDGSLLYFHSVISQKSKYVYPGAGSGVDFIGVTDRVRLGGDNSGFTSTDPSIGLTNSGNKVYPLIKVGTTSFVGFSFDGGADYNFATEALAIETAVTEGYELVRDSETFNDIDFLVPGRISLTRAAKLIDIAEARRDCMTVISPRQSDVVNGNSNADKTDSIIDFFDQITSSSFAIFDSGYKYIYDKFNDVYRYVPCAADVAGLCISTTINSETWFSPAGYNRGNLRNATKLAYSPKQAERDRLYSARINPIVSFPGQGIVLFGDKTALASPSAFNRINVRRLFIELEKNVARFAKYQLFEINDDLTRSSFKAAVEPYLRNVQGRRGIYDFLVVCDESNNTPDVIDANEFNAEIYIKPARSINFITITFIATRTGISFSELIN